MRTRRSSADIKSNNPHLTGGEITIHVGKYTMHGSYRFTDLLIELFHCYQSLLGKGVRLCPLETAKVGAVNLAERPSSVDVRSGLW